MKEPLVSVIIPAWNAEKTITEALDSVRKQTYTSWEIFVIDDYSTDNTAEVVRSYINSHEDLDIKLICSTENKGPSYSRNIGIRQASGKYISLLDSDDYYHEKKLEAQVEFMERNPDVVACSTGIQCFGMQNNILCPKNTEWMKDTLLLGLPFIHASFFFNREYFISHDLFYDETYRSAEDYELAIRIYENGGQISNIQHPYHYYRISGSQESFLIDKEGNKISNPKQVNVARNLQYKIWRTFLPENAPLDNVKYTEILLGHRGAESVSELTEFSNWMDAILLKNREDKLFNNEFLENIRAQRISNYFTGAASFSVEHLMKYLKYRKYSMIKNSTAELKFILKCLTGHSYS